MAHAIEPSPRAGSTTNWYTTQLSPLNTRYVHPILCVTCCPPVQAWFPFIWLPVRRFRAANPSGALAAALNGKGDGKAMLRQMQESVPGALSRTPRIMPSDVRCGFCIASTSLGERSRRCGGRIGCTRRIACFGTYKHVKSVASMPMDMPGSQRAGCMQVCILRVRETPPDEDPIPTSQLASAAKARI